MAKFLLRRLVEAILALLSIAVLLFFILHIDTTSPARAILGQEATPAKIAQLNAKLGLNQPVPVQFVYWLKAILINGGIASIIKKELPPTVELLVMGILLALLLSIIVARVQARYHNTFIDRILSLIIALLSAIPGFWMGSLLLFLFAILYPLFPPTGFPRIHPGLISWAWHEVLPVTTLALSTMGPWSRQLRVALHDASLTQYVRTARAKGVAEHHIIPHHTLKNSLLPLITLVGLSMPMMLNTVVAIEVIYAVPGAGNSLVSALDGLMFSNAASIALVLAFLTILGSILADVSYSLVDPRVQYR